MWYVKVQPDVTISSRKEYFYKSKILVKDSKLWKQKAQIYLT